MTDNGYEISVVIATVGRAAHLQSSLAAYESMIEASPSFEVVVVLDGEDPESRAVAERQRPYPVRLVSQTRAGNGPAKNLGAEAAGGRLVVFLNDDTRPAPNCLAVHAAAQKRVGPCVAVGRVEWDPDTTITPYMEWLAPAGHQFNFDRLDPGRPAPWDATWGAHLAMPRRWLLDEPFDPGFPYPSLEDIEWGWRVSRKGLPIRYLPEAICFHDHRYDGPRDYRTRAHISGAASRYVVRRHPRLFWTLISRPAGAATVRALSMLWPGNWKREMVWDLDFRWNYVLGVLQSRLRDRLHR